MLESTPLIRLYVDPDVALTEAGGEKNHVLEWEKQGVNLEKLRNEEKEIVQLAGTGEN